MSESIFKAGPRRGETPAAAPYKPAEPVKEKKIEAESVYSSSDYLDPPSVFSAEKKIPPRTEPVYTAPPRRETVFADTDETEYRYTPPRSEPASARTAVRVSPVGQLTTNRGLFRFFFFSVFTLGIYAVFFMSAIPTDINIIAHRYDGKKTMPFLLAVLLMSVTFGLSMVFWYHRLSDRIGYELHRRSIRYSFGSGSFWGWCVLGCLILIGPMIYMHKLCKAMNLLSESYNEIG